MPLDNATFKSLLADLVEDAGVGAEEFGENRDYQLSDSGTTAFILEYEYDFSTMKQVLIRRYRLTPMITQMHLEGDAEL